MPRAAFGLLLLALPAAAQSITMDRAAYQDRLRAMWLGECIANWTGLNTEGARSSPPFFTDADWNTQIPGGNYIGFITWQDPWLADDDTDIEYVYLHEMTQRATPSLSAAAVRGTWLAHMNSDYIWVSNRRAWDLMHRGITPPSTGMPVANDLWAQIDAQLTTEFFGALAPARPDRALALADLPIATTAYGFSMHAAQFYAVLYSLAPLIPQNLSGRDQAIWLVTHARPWIPSTSKSADIADFVLADFLNNPDLNNWELTRDRIYQRYQLNASANGFWYRQWTESSVNFACGVMCLLYGQMDYRRTVQIGTLSGWDSDNCTATMGGLIGLARGTQYIADQFPGVQLSDRFNIFRTRIDLPDYLPLDLEAQDTLTLMAARMMPRIDQTVKASGGIVDLANNRWVIPTPIILNPVELNPGRQLERRSANFRLHSLGASIQCSSSAANAADPALFANGFEADFRGLDQQDFSGLPYATGALAPGQVVTLTVAYDRPVPIQTVRFMEGDHTAAGGWFDSLSLELLINNQWQPGAFQPSEPLDPTKPFQIIDLKLNTPAAASGVRLTGQAGGTGPRITCAEIDALSPPLSPASATSANPPP
jgi:hypothetical protein